MLKELNNKFDLKLVLMMEKVQIYVPNASKVKLVWRFVIV